MSLGFCLSLSQLGFISWRHPQAYCVRMMGKMTTHHWKSQTYSPRRGKPLFSLESVRQIPKKTLRTVLRPRAQLCQGGGGCCLIRLHHGFARVGMGGPREPQDETYLSK